MDIVWFGEPACADVALAGGKAGSLSRLAASYRVPPGFCVTTTAYAAAMSNSASGSMGTGALPDSLSAAVAAAYQSLAYRVDQREPAVAVRSSAADEDGGDSSFAGQHETYLNISGAEAVLDAIGRCWASATTARALDYRRQQGLAVSGVRLAVLVQQLIAADSAAVVFSANPITGRRDEVVINANWGLGESIVGGTVTPDTYVVGKADLALRSRQVAEKRRMTVPIPGGTREVDVPRLLRSQPCLDDTQAAEAADLARSLEAAMGWPVDVECAFRDGTLYLLQCRPITTLRHGGADVRSSS